MGRSWVTITGVVVLAVFVGALAGCGASEPVQVVFTVEGMTCESCSAAITETLSKVEVVEQLSAEIEGLGYTVTATEVTPVQG